MIFGIGDTVNVTNNPGDGSALGWMGLYHQNEYERKQELDVEMLLFAGLAIAQMLYYWDKVDDHTDARDCAIGKFAQDNMGMLGFMWELENYRDTVDFPILMEKAAIKDRIDFGEWEPDSCSTATLYVDELQGDGSAIDNYERMFAACSCAGIPEGWGIHDGTLVAGLGAAYSGPIANIAAVEMFEDFKGHAISVVQKAQMAMKAIYNISGIMRYYEQAIAIHEGLATMFIQGFNSAGAMLGTALGKLAAAAPGSGNSVSVGGKGMPGGGGSSSSAIGIGTTASAGVRGGP